MSGTETELFFVQKPFGLNPGEIRSALKTLICSRYPLAEENALPALEIRPDEMFFKMPRRLLWGKIFFQTVESRDLPALASDLVKLRGVFTHEIQMVLFYPSLDPEVRQGLRELGIRIHPFQYQALAAEHKNGLAVQFQSLNGEADTETAASAQSTRLSREEMSELIDIALGVKTTSLCETP